MMKTICLLLRKTYRKILLAYEWICFHIYFIREESNDFKNRSDHAKYRAKLTALCRKFRHCGERLFVDFPIIIHEPDKIEIGNDVALGAFVLIWGGGTVNIGDRVMIATHCVIDSQSHDSYVEQPRWTEKNLPIVIEDDVWLGAGSIIMPGIRIGRGAIVGAGAVVTKDVAPFDIVVGVPAKKIRNKKMDDSKVR